MLSSASVSILLLQTQVLVFAQRLLTEPTLRTLPVLNVMLMVTPGGGQGYPHFTDGAVQMEAPDITCLSQAWSPESLRLKGADSCCCRRLTRAAFGKRLQEMHGPGPLLQTGGPWATLQCFVGASSERGCDVVGPAISQPLPLSFTQQPPPLILDPQADTTAQLEL